MSYALITGASKGIGKAIAEELAARGINLLLVARSGSLLEQLAADLARTHGIKCDHLAIDLADSAAAAAVANWVVEKNYPVHILVNNAGYGLSGSFE